MNMECSNDRLANADIHSVNTLDKRALCFSLSKFVTEVIKVNREDYPPNTLKELIYSIQMYLHSKRVFWFLLDRSNIVFLDLFYVLDTPLRVWEW